jgi:hypothetical protein
MRVDPAVVAVQVASDPDVGVPQPTAPATTGPSLASEELRQAFG